MCSKIECWRFGKKCVQLDLQKRWVISYRGECSDQIFKWSSCPYWIEYTTNKWCPICVPSQWLAPSKTQLCVLHTCTTYHTYKHTRCDTILSGNENCTYVNLVDTHVIRIHAVQVNSYLHTAIVMSHSNRKQRPTIYHHHLRYHTETQDTCIFIHTQRFRYTELLTV